MTGQFHPTTKRVPYKAIKCGNCPVMFNPVRSDGVYCSTTCKDEAKNRAMLRGKQAYQALYHWVTVPVAERGSLATLMGNIARGWRDADRDNGRAPPPMPSGLSEVQAVSGINKGRLRK